MLFININLVVFLGSDGHTLALTENGHVYSWGDGDYGKLGHGNCVTHKQPERIAGPFLGKTIKYINAGYRHSAAITDDGRLWTWGKIFFNLLQIYFSIDFFIYFDNQMVYFNHCYYNFLKFCMFC